ncbi:MAG: hypothetical protein NTW52_18585 [Planctomycetota bacterium]|nr:hypothetical protein [Planctomycetota bacterium]
MQKIPATKIQYEGQNDDAGWRTEAEQRIRDNRMSSVTVQVLDSAGNRQWQQDERKAKLTPNESVPEISGKESNNDHKAESNAMREPDSKSFELTVPKMKSSKPKVPRIENFKGPNEATRSF